MCPAASHPKAPACERGQRFLPSVVIKVPLFRSGPFSLPKNFPSHPPVFPGSTNSPWATGWCRCRVFRHLGARCARGVRPAPGGTRLRASWSPPLRRREQPCARQDNPNAPQTWPRVPWEKMAQPLPPSPRPKTTELPERLFSAVAAGKGGGRGAPTGPSDQNQMHGFDHYAGAHFTATCFVSGGAPRPLQGAGRALRTPSTRPRSLRAVRVMTCKPRLR